MNHKKVLPKFLIKWLEPVHFFNLYGFIVDYVVGFGGKFGVQKDRQDKSAVGYDHTEEIPKHHSQTDHKKVKMKNLIYKSE